MTSSDHTDSTAAGPGQRQREEILADAIRILTEAGRQRRTVLRQTETGTWEPHPTQTEQSDWAEFVTLAVAGAAANLGGIEASLAGRSGSWEASRVRDLLVSTAGDDDGLLDHRTEPLRIELHVDDIVSDVAYEFHRSYDKAAVEARHLVEIAESRNPEADMEAHCWVYTFDGTAWVSADPAAPAWTREAQLADLLSEGWEQPNADLLLDGIEGLNEYPRPERLYLPRTDEDRAELARLEAEREERMAPVWNLEEQLDNQQRAELAAYGESLKAYILEHARELLGGRDLEVLVDVDTETVSSTWTPADETSLEHRLVQQAVEAVPTPADLPGTPLERLAQAASDAE